MEEKKTFYITTPIYYPSGRFHIGTAYSTVVANTIKKYKEARGYEAYFLTGLDEHGQKIQEVALKRGLTPQEHVDEMAEAAKNLWKLMKIENNDFIRTTEERHSKIVEDIFDRLMEQGDIYKGEYEGLYCVPCETYFTQTQLINGKCPDCGRDVRKMKEEAYFFNMKKYQSRIEKFYEEHPDFIEPEYRKNELLNNFIKPGLEDLCVTRTTFDWGVKVRKDPKHVVYVWLDALVNYITALGYGSSNDELFKKFWPADVHVVGKDIIRFHGIYWPIFLMALDLPLPKKLFAHGWVMMKDGKMSKSVGNVVYPELLINRYGLDATKYYLLRTMSNGQDLIFTPEDFIDRFNFDLCNDLGNLLNRTIGMINKYFEGKIPKYNGHKNDVDKELEDYTLDNIKVIEEQFDNYKIAQGIETIWKIIARTNKYIDETMPWSLAKSEEDKEKLEAVMNHLYENLRKIAILINPFLTDTSNKIFEQLGIKSAEFKIWNSIYKNDIIENDAKVIEKGEPLFMRLDKETEIEFIKDGMKNG